ncbi:MAG: ribose 5-phosphate isomerase B [Phycisphaerae bacterium]|nr:ribose 5-phosphate isomerase B [Phycisphaerae bacterium]
MNIAIGSDHRGSETARHLAEHLRATGHQVDDAIELPQGPCDYPDQAWLVASKVADGSIDRGILICGTGIGMCIAANKVPGIRAALAPDELSAELSRSHNDSNILCLSGDLIGKTLAKRIVEVWLQTEHEGGRHMRRLDKIKVIEQGNDPATMST